MNSKVCYLFLIIGRVSDCLLIDLVDKHTDNARPDHLVKIH
jgi:hypothetical protein